MMQSDWKQEFLKLPCPPNTFYWPYSCYYWLIQSTDILHLDASTYQGLNLPSVRKYGICRTALVIVFHAHTSQLEVLLWAKHYLRNNQISDVYPVNWRTTLRKWILNPKQTDQALTKFIQTVRRNQFKKYKLQDSYYKMSFLAN